MVFAFKIFSDLALVNIMLLAGLNIEWKALLQNLGVIIRLTLFPTFVEVAVITILGHFMLNMPWLWGILLG